MQRVSVTLAVGGLVSWVGCGVAGDGAGAGEAPAPPDPHACENDDEGGSREDGEPLEYDDDSPLADDFVDPGNPQAGAYEVGTAWDKRVLRVCFTSAGHSTEKAWIREAIQSSWQAVAGIRFTDWSDCDDAKDGDISIELEEFGNGGSSAFGTESLLAHPSMHITVDYEEAGCGHYTPCNEFVDDNGKTGRQNCIEEVAKHEFGHALALRHEQARPDSTCNSNEDLDVPGVVDGQELWSYDDASVMNYCHLGTVDNAILSQGDVHTINSLYPGPVRVFSEMDFQGESQAFGLGTWLTCDMKIVNGDEITSIVVPPGMRATVCDADDIHCETFIQSTNLQAPLCNNVGSIEIDARLHLYDETGFRGNPWLYLEPGTYFGGVGWWPVIEDAASSIIVPPGISAGLCSDVENGEGTGACLLFRGHQAMAHDLPPLLDDAVSFADVRPRVVAYTRPQYEGELYSYDFGTYVESDGTLAHPALVSSLSIPGGMQVRACTDEGGGSGGGTCVTIRRSQAELPPTIDEAIRYLEVGLADTLPGDLLCIGGIE